MTFRSRSLLDKHKENFCIGSEIGDPFTLNQRFTESWDQGGGYSSSWRGGGPKRTHTLDFVMLVYQTLRNTAESSTGPALMELGKDGVETAALHPLPAPHPRTADLKPNPTNTAQPSNAAPHILQTPSLRTPRSESAQHPSPQTAQRQGPQLSDPNLILRRMGEEYQN